MKQYQDHDTDAWQFWVSKKSVSFHKTIEGAKAKIAEITLQKLIELPEEMKRNSHISNKDEYWNRRKAQIENNKDTFSSSQGGEKPYEDDLYIIGERILLD